jgi:hypothetical protein
MIAVDPGVATYAVAALAGVIVGIIPLLVGGALLAGGTAAAVKGASEGDKKKNFRSDPRAFASPTTKIYGKKVWDPKTGKYRTVEAEVPGSRWGPPDWYKTMGDKFNRTPRKGYVGEARGAMRQGLGGAWKRATGKESYARAMAKDQANRMRAAAHSQAKGASGGYNPAAQRQAILSGSAAGSQIAGKASMAEQAERLGALKMYMQGAQGMHKSEADWFSKQAAWEKSRSDMARDWTMTGLLDKEAQRNAAIKKQMLDAGVIMKGNEMANQSQGQWLNFGGQMIGGAGRVVGSG